VFIALRTGAGVFQSAMIQIESLALLPDFFERIVKDIPQNRRILFTDRNLAVK
jgi:hypothetical protein